MTDQKIDWGMVFAIVALFFTVYTVAKDAVLNAEETKKAVFLAGIFWILLISMILIGYYYITNRLIKSKK